MSSTEFLVHIHDLFLLKLGTSRNLALSLANSFGERQQNRLKLPLLSTLSLPLLSLQWVRIPDIFGGSIPQGMMD